MNINTILLVAILVSILVGFTKKPAYCMTLLVGIGIGVVFTFVIAMTLQDGSYYVLRRGFYMWEDFLIRLLHIALKISVLIVLPLFVLTYKKKPVSTVSG